MAEFNEDFWFEGDSVVTSSGWTFSITKVQEFSYTARILGYKIYNKGDLVFNPTEYFSPVDLFSELFVGVPGYIEDVVLSAYVLNDLVNEVDASIIEKHWTGDEDLLEVVRKMISSADRILGSGLFRRIKKFLRQK